MKGLRRSRTPIDLASAAAKEIIDARTAESLHQERANQLSKAGFNDADLKPELVLICYIPAGSIERTPHGRIETRQCDVELVHRAPLGPV